MELLDTNEAGAFLKTPPKTLVAWRCTKRVKIPYVRVGGNIRYKKSDLESFIAANVCDADTANGGA